MPDQVRHDEEEWTPGQISTWLPSSTTRLIGSLKNSIALSELLSIQEKSRSRHRGARDDLYARFTPSPRLPMEA